MVHDAATSIHGSSNGAVYVSDAPSINAVFINAMLINTALVIAA